MRGIQSVNFVDDIHMSYTGMHAMYLLQRWRGQEKLSWEGAKKKKKQTQNSRDSQIIKFRKPNSSLHLIFCNLSYSKFQVFVLIVLSPKMALKKIQLIDAYIWGSVGVVTYFLFYMLMIYYSHQMILTCWLRQSTCCQPILTWRILVRLLMSWA